MSDEFEKDIHAESEGDDSQPNDILTLVDEDNNEHQFEVVDTAEFEGKNYIALIPIFDKPEELLDDSGELVILQVLEENGEQYLEAIEDEAEFDRVGNFFVGRLEDEFDFED